MKRIEEYIEQTKTMDGGNHRTKAYKFVNDGLILVRKAEPDFFEMQRRLKKLKELQVNIPMYIDYRYDGENYWLLEEVAPGKEMESLLNENRVKLYDGIPYEHYEKYVKDVYLLNINGLGCEPRPRNVFYSEEKGFTTIDVAVLSSEEEPDSLENVNYFFKTFYPLLINPLRYEDDQKVIDKTTINVMKAFENGHPFFKKYAMWIYRGDDYFSDFLEKHGYDLALNHEEYKYLIYLIDSLIDSLTQKVLDNPELIYNLVAQRGYMDILNGAISHCEQFNLFESKEQNLFDFIKISVWEKIKLMFLENLNDENLKKLYYEIRRRELNPVRKYSEEYIIRLIDEEIKDLNNKKLTDSKELSKR